MTRRPPPRPIPDEHAGVIDRRALATVERARSPRNGRLVARSTALAEYRTSRDSVPIRGGTGSTAEQGMQGGMWDYGRESAMGPRRGPPRPPRKDAAAMAAFVERRGNELSSHEWEVYKRFWDGRRSYGEVAVDMGTRRERVYECIKRLRVKCANAGFAAP